jgi:hypothetical protein
MGIVKIAAQRWYSAAIAFFAAKDGVDKKDVVKASRCFSVP